MFLLNGIITTVAQKFCTTMCTIWKFRHAFLKGSMMYWPNAGEQIWSHCHNSFFEDLWSFCWEVAVCMFSVMKLSWCYVLKLFQWYIDFWCNCNGHLVSVTQKCCSHSTKRFDHKTQPDRWALLRNLLVYFSWVVPTFFLGNINIG